MSFPLPPTPHPLSLVVRAHTRSWSSTEALKTQEPWGGWEEPNPAALLGENGVQVMHSHTSRHLSETERLLEGTKDNSSVWQASMETQKESTT